VWQKLFNTLYHRSDGVFCIRIVCVSFWISYSCRHWTGQGAVTVFVLLSLCQVVWKPVYPLCSCKQAYTHTRKFNICSCKLRERVLEANSSEKRHGLIKMPYRITRELPYFQITCFQRNDQAYRYPFSVKTICASNSKNGSGNGNVLQNDLGEVWRTWELELM
jgi:hypothetical protein